MEVHAGGLGVDPPAQLSGAVASGGQGLVPAALARMGDRAHVLYISVRERRLEEARGPRT